MEEYEATLTGLGFSSGGVKVYMALLSKESLTARDVAQLTGLSRPMAYTILRMLQKKGLCTQVSGKTLIFKATEPRFALGALLQQQEESLHGARLIVNDLQVLYDQSQTTFRPLDYIEILRDKRLILDRFSRLVNGTRERIDSFAIGPFVSNLQTPNSPGEASLRRGVKARAIYDVNDMTSELLIKDVQHFATLGEEARIAPNLPMKLTVFDNEIVMCALKDPITGKPSLTAIVIEQPDFARSMAILFDYYWKLGTPLKKFIAALDNQTGSRAGEVVRRGRK